MTKKLLALLFALLAPTMLLTACGDDDDDAGDDASTEMTEDETSDEETDSEGIDQATLEAFIDAINEDPSIVCDPDNATEELLESMGGVEGCLEASAEEAGGEPYEIVDITIDGDTATATIADDDSESTVEFVQEGDQLKIAG